MKKGFLCFILILVMLSSVLTSCGIFEQNGSVLDGEDGKTQAGVADTAQNDSEGGTQINNITNNSVTINADGANYAYAAANGLRSAVSIYCSFETTYYTGSLWNPTPVTQTYYTAGSGVIYTLENDGSAFIITNYHVVYDSSSNTEDHVSDEIYVYLYGLESSDYAISAYFVGGSANYDIAVLRVDKSEVLRAAAESGSAAAVSIADSDTLVPGDVSIAIGNPSTSEVGGISVTKGVVSVDSEYITMSASDNSGEVTFRVIRTDTPINSGNSGGGLFNAEGELIGIVNAKINSSSIENIGYAIPSNVARAIADNIIYYCYGKDCSTVMRCLLGITVDSAAMYSEYIPELGIIRKSEDVRVYEVSKDGAADGALLAGDILKGISIGDATLDITQRHHIIDAMLDVRVGDTLTVTVERTVDGTSTVLDIQITVTEEFVVAY